MKAPDVAERLIESEKLMKEMSKTWEEKLQETERIHQVSAVQQPGLTFPEFCQVLPVVIYFPCFVFLASLCLFQFYTRCGI